MPLHWTIDSRFKLFSVIADGHVDFGEVNRMLDAMAGADAHGYRKLFDGSQGDTQMSPTEILSLGVRMRSIHTTGPMGPLAMVVPDDKYYLIARVLGMLAAARRPMRVFKDPQKARQWLDLPAICANVPGLVLSEASNDPPAPTENSPAIS